MAVSKESRISIIGGGIAGLMTAYRLAEYGLRPVVLEKCAQAAHGATTRNQGWLHAGALHAQSIEDHDKAVLVSSRCRMGHEQILRLCPEAIEDRLIPSIAFTKEQNRVDEIESRWRSANVKNELIHGDDLKRFVPSLNIDDIEAAWIVDDAVVDTRLLCTKLVAMIRHLGGDVLFNAEILDLDNNCLNIQVNGESRMAIRSEFTIITCGHGANSLVERLWGRAMKMRYWKSHLVISPNLLESNIFCVDSHGASFLRHGNYTLIGRLHDNIPCSKPDLEVDQKEIDLTRIEAAKIVRLPNNSEMSSVACIKVDIADSAKLSRNLDVEIVDLEPNVLCAFPGKMTEAPFLADIILRRVLKDLNSFSATPRPLDEWSIEMTSNASD